MNNINAYIDWRGDLPFKYSPFNDVDSYIVSKIGSPDFTGIVPEDEGEISIGEAMSIYQKKYGEAGSYMGALASASIFPTIAHLSFTERFRDIKLSGFVKKIDDAATEQFSALTIHLPDGRYYISYRGTDDTILGWKENLMMSIDEAVQAQTDALAYLEWAASVYKGELIVGGHSKGGNLAEFAAVKVSEEIQNRIIDVYNFDGPGFHKDFFLSDGFSRIEPKLHIIWPQHSLVGTLITQGKKPVIVKAARAGIAAHDGFTWEVRGTSFVRCKALSKASVSFDETMNKMIATMTIEERRNVIEEISEILEETGAVTLTDMTEHTLRQAVVIAKSLRKSSETKKFATALIELMAKEYKTQISLSRK